MRSVVRGCLVLVCLAACLATTADANSDSREPAGIRADWHLGDEWGYRYESPSGSGTFVWVVARLHSESGLEHYVVKSGAREIYYRRQDLRFTRETVAGEIVREVTPPIVSFAVVPLAIGHSVTIRYHEVRPAERPGQDFERAWTVEGQEMVTVPAGSFSTFRIVCKNVKDDTWVRTVWYSPAVKHFVRDETALPDGGRRVRQLLHFRLL
jgi:hypothetical protein